MRIDSHSSHDTNTRKYSPTREEYSKFVDRANAQRFKSMVGRHVAETKLGVPFGLERPEAAAAHRELEEELKPAAREIKSKGFLNPVSSNGHSFASTRPGNEVVLAALGLCGLVFAFTALRAFK